MTMKIIQTIGSVTKKEKLASVEHLTKGTALVLESQQPYPGYHGSTIPDHLEPDSLFVVTKIQYNDERIIRAIQYVKKQISLHFDAAPGTISLQNKPVNVIRFKFLSYNAIAEVLGYFKDAGIEFMKDKKIAPYDSLIRIRKYFTMQQLADHIYQDIETPDFYYIVVPVLMRWNTFEKVTMQLKYNLQDHNFDAALSSVYNESGLLDMVRIYDQKANIEKLQFIRSKYLDGIQ